MSAFVLQRSLPLLLSGDFPRGVLLLAALIVLLIGFGLTVLMGAWVLPLLRRLHVGQTVRSDGPKSHFIKSGTPTFGGLLFLPVFLVGGLVFWGLQQIPSLFNHPVIGLLLGRGKLGDHSASLSTDSLLFAHPSASLLVCLLAVLACAALGFADDYVKVRISREGLSVRQKTWGLLLVCSLLTLFLLTAAGDPLLYLPGLRTPLKIFGVWKLLYGVFLVIYFYFCINAVNLTDGVDGLASSVTALSTLAPLALALIWGSVGWLPLVGVWVTGCCLGFFFYNHHPAKLFMGDTGSLALGAVVSLIPVLLGVPWLFLFTGLIYVAEALSVVIQVSYFRATGGKRIFRMSPIHHHFELGGWSEWKIVGRFCLVTALALVLGLLLVATYQPR